jgi:hypothetical protein
MMNDISVDVNITIDYLIPAVSNRFSECETFDVKELLHPQKHDTNSYSLHNQSPQRGIINMQRCRHDSYNVDPLANDVDRRVLRVLAFLKDEGFPTIAPFLEALFTSEHHGLKSRVGRFYEKGGFKSTIRVMVRNSRFAVEKKVTAARTNDLKSYIGDEIVDLCIRIFQQELKEAADNGSTSKRPSDMTPEDAEQFDLAKCALKVQEKAPMFSRLVRTLCCVAGEKRKDGDGQLFDAPAGEEDAIHEEEEVPSDRESDDEESPATRRKPKRRLRNKEMIATMVSYSILFARSKNNNYLQVYCYTILYQARD